MSRPRALDLCCGAGGASVGLSLAGFDVMGVDIRWQKNYPFPLLVCDALALPIDPRQFDFIWASPPCQRWSRATPDRVRHRYPDLLTPMRAMLESIGIDWAIENVPGAPLRPDVTLNGGAFGLSVIRRRAFECSFPVTQPQLPKMRGDVQAGRAVTVAGGGGDGVDLASWSAAMGIDWMSRREIVDAVPPAYAEYIGSQAMRSLPRRRDASTSPGSGPVNGQVLAQLDACGRPESGPVNGQVLAELQSPTRPASGLVGERSSAADRSQPGPASGPAAPPAGPGYESTDRRKRSGVVGHRGHRAAQ